MTGQRDSRFASRRAGNNAGRAANPISRDVRMGLMAFALTSCVIYVGGAFHQ